MFFLLGMILTRRVRVFLFRFQMPCSLVSSMVIQFFGGRPGKICPAVAIFRCRATTLSAPHATHARQKRKTFSKRICEVSVYPSSGVIRFNRCPDAVFFPKAAEDQRFRIRSCFSFQYLRVAVIDIITLLTSLCYVG